jgi:hypothetical protein
MLSGDVHFESDGVYIVPVQLYHKPKQARDQQTGDEHCDLPPVLSDVYQPPLQGDFVDSLFAHGFITNYLR